MKTKLRLGRARGLADKIKAILEPTCERIQIAGSIRRMSPHIGDIEMVAIPKLLPKLEAQLSLLGGSPKLVSALDLLIEALVISKPNFERGHHNEECFKSFLIRIDENDSKIGLNLFITTVEQWGYILALRTGPSKFNRAWVTQISQGGLLPNVFYFAGGYLHGYDGVAIPTPDEDEFFKLILGGTIAPQERHNWQRYHEQEVMR